jgi:hypothetical protein
VRQSELFQVLGEFFEGRFSDETCSRCGRLGVSRRSILASQDCAQVGHGFAVLPDVQYGRETWPRRTRGIQAKATAFRLGLPMEW